MTITVHPVNHALVANDDAYSTGEDHTLNVDASSGVLKNDTDADRDKPTAVKESDPASGTLTLNPDCSFTYAPNTGFSGADSFTYKASDGTNSRKAAKEAAFPVKTR